MCQGTYVLTRLSFHKRPDVDNGEAIMSKELRVSIGAYEISGWHTLLEPLRKIRYGPCLGSSCSEAQVINHLRSAISYTVTRAMTSGERLSTQ